MKSKNKKKTKSLRKQKKPYKPLRLIAIIWGSLVLAILLFFVLGDIINPESEPGQNQGPTTLELISFIFILGIITGLALSYKWPITGGITTILSFILFGLYQRIFHVNDFNFFLSVPFLLIMSPGIIYLIYGILLKRKKH